MPAPKFPDLLIYLNEDLKDQDVTFTRKYQKLWHEIKKAPIAVGVTVRAPVAIVPAVIRGLRKEKSKECVVKKRIGMLRPGELLVEISDDSSPSYKLITFKLKENFSKL